MLQLLVCKLTAYGNETRSHPLFSCHADLVTTPSASTSDKEATALPAQWDSLEEKTSIQKFLYPEPEDLPDDFR